MAHSIEMYRVDVEQLAWVIALGTWVVGDLATTSIGLALGGAELHPVAAPLIEALGVWVLASVQGVALLVFVLGWGALRARERVERVGIPIGLALLGVAIVINNTVVILQLI